MRLSLFEIETIVKLKHKFFGSLSKIYLFGSRTDDKKRGGDIDLYLETENRQDIFKKKQLFLRELKNTLGEQKIDLVLAQEDNRLIDTEAKEGIELDLNKVKLQKYLNECEKHMQRIEEAYTDIQDSIPLTVEKYKNLSKDEVQDIDQYLYRFSKLQDTLGQKIFKLLVDIYEPSYETLPFADVLHKLEKLNFLESAKEWMHLRDVRNKIAHQYDDEPFEMTQALNDILNQKDILKAIFERFKHKAEVLTLIS